MPYNSLWLQEPINTGGYLAIVRRGREVFEYPFPSDAALPLAGVELEGALSRVFPGGGYEVVSMCRVDDLSAWLAGLWQGESDPNNSSNTNIASNEGIARDCNLPAI